MTTYEMPWTNCPRCGLTLNRATTLKGSRAPEPGDLTVCEGCGEALLVTERRRVRCLQDQERARIQVDEPWVWEEIETIQATLQALKRSRRGEGETDAHRP